MLDSRAACIVHSPLNNWERGPLMYERQQRRIFECTPGWKVGEGTGEGTGDLNQVGIDAKERAARDRDSISRVRFGDNTKTCTVWDRDQRWRSVCGR